EAWAKPYVETGWMITALQVAKDKDGKAKDTVAAGALRLSFPTDRPLFPYREPDSRSAVEALGIKKRLLRIYFLAEARYRESSDMKPAFEAVWANKLDAEQRKKILELLKLPGDTGPAEWWLTEFEHAWPYQLASDDVYFSRDPKQDTIKRPPIIRYVASAWPTDLAIYAFAAAIVLPPIVRRLRRPRDVIST